MSILISDVLPFGRLSYGERMQSETQSAMHNCAVGLGFRVCSPYCHGQDCGTPKPRKKKQKRYDYACAVLIIHRFPFSLLNDRDVLGLFHSVFFMKPPFRRANLWSAFGLHKTHFVSLSQSGLTADSSSETRSAFHPRKTIQR